MNPSLKKHKKNGISKEEMESVSEETASFIDQQLVSFIDELHSKELSFPDTFSNIDRKLVHTLAKDYGLKSKSRGVEPKRFVTVYKGDNFRAPQKLLKLKPQSLDLIDDLLAKNPLTESEQNLQPESSHSTSETGTCQLGRIKLLQPTTDVNRTKGFRNVLPIKPYEQEILLAIEGGRVTIVIGETGSGKTTQVPQMIMEHAESHGKKCQIICSMPRRVAAISISERVAFERGEQLGSTVGYQIRLESRVTHKTILTYCTNGVLLRSLLKGDDWLRNVSHIILDEVHERDKFTDFTLIVLKNALVKYKNLKLILMSATIDSGKFQNYFKDCPVVNDDCKVVRVPGKLYEVKEIYLEHILQGTEYMSPEMTKLKKEQDIEGSQRTQVKGPVLTLDKQIALIDLNVRNEMDRILDTALKTGSTEAMKNLIDFMNNNQIPVDYQHPDCGRTAVMAAAIHSDIDAVDDLIHMDPDLSIRSKEGKTALMYAEETGDSDILEWFDAYKNYCDQKNATSAATSECQVNASEIPPQVQELVDIYEKCHIMKDIDEHLILCVLQAIQADGREGAVLIFLPGYDHIMCVKDIILDNISSFKSRPLDLHILHSRMKTTDQKKVFEPGPPGRRKVILSTNIAETSITINDVSFVIDCGKIKELNYNSLNGAYSLECGWISQSCADQRRGRAGRTREGVCFRLYSKKRYESLSRFQVPELLREPIAELCLQAKQLAPTGTSIAEFLGKAIDPPLPDVTRTTINLLKQMEALTANEELTVLGRHLLNIPIDPHFGKMIVYAIVLRCLDPVLTIACALSGGEVFKLPSNPELKARITQMRLGLSRNSLSDHLVYLNAFREWEAAVRAGKDKKWCQDNFIISSAMDGIVASKHQILCHLRLTGPENARKLNHNSENWAVVKAALTAGLYPNLAKVDIKRKCLRTVNDLTTVVHTSSVLKSRGNARERLTALPSEWVLYEESHAIRGLKNLRTCTLVSPATVCVFAGPSQVPQPTKVCREDKDEFGASTLHIDPFLQFAASDESARCLQGLRQKWCSFVKRSMNSLGHIKPDQVDENLLSTIVNVLSIEDQPQMNANPMEKEISYEGKIFYRAPHIPGMRRVPMTKTDVDLNTVDLENIPSRGRGKALRQIIESYQAEYSSKRGGGDFNRSNSQTRGRGRGRSDPRTLETTWSGHANCDYKTVQDQFADITENSAAEAKAISVELTRNLVTGAGRGDEPSWRDHHNPTSPYQHHHNLASPHQHPAARGRGRGRLMSYLNQTQPPQPSNYGQGSGLLCVAQPLGPWVWGPGGWESLGLVAGARRGVAPSREDRHNPASPHQHLAARRRGGGKGQLISRFEQLQIQTPILTNGQAVDNSHEHPAPARDQSHASAHNQCQQTRPSVVYPIDRGNVPSNSNKEADEQIFIDQLLERRANGDDEATEILLNYGTFLNGVYYKGYRMFRGRIVPMKDGNPNKNIFKKTRGKSRRGRGNTRQETSNDESGRNTSISSVASSTSSLHVENPALHEREEKGSLVQLPINPAWKQFRFFLIKKGNMRMVKSCFYEGRWPVTQTTAERIKAFEKHTEHIYLILCIQSGDRPTPKNAKIHLQGYGKILGLSEHQRLTLGQSEDLSSPLDVEWRVKTTLTLDGSFEYSNALKNTPDGGELEEMVANMLFAIWSRQHLEKTGHRLSLF